MTDSNKSSSEHVLLDEAALRAGAEFWVEFQGYDIDKARSQTHQNSGCEFEGQGWNCIDEDGNWLHPEKDALDEAAEMVVELAEFWMKRQAAT